MSSLLVAPDGNLARLEAKGRRFAIRANYIVMAVPYLNCRGELRRGFIADPLNLTGGTEIGLPANHQMYFLGEDPSGLDGQSLLNILGGGANRTLIFDDNYSSYYFSHKIVTPLGQMRDYGSLFEKFEQYYQVISGPAVYKFPEADQLFLDVDFGADLQSLFNFPDTHSSHAELHELNRRISHLAVGIVGLGGTGSYVLDLLSKTPVKALKLFDDDEYVVKNSYRSPGTTRFEDFKKSKVDLYVERYSSFRTGVTGQVIRVTQDTPGAIPDCDFVFLCVDKGESRAKVVELLNGLGKPFIDVGMGLTRTDGPLNGRVRATLVDDETRSAVLAGSILPMVDNADHEYQTNIQIAELNALNAALAVILFKKRFGYYADTDPGYNLLMNLDRLKIFRETLA
ncbi:ThiF family adenylyltransferase [Mesorhizobium sp. M0644]|uniref:DUF6791 domain-containing protein n=1 Tax=Mesorhizobium sp. M0644 TaxID=2956979 RepID=UPI0033391330